jgi:hypothetical protein
LQTTTKPVTSAFKPTALLPTTSQVEEHRVDNKAAQVGANIRSDVSVNIVAERVRVLLIDINDRGRPRCDN